MKKQIKLTAELLYSLCIILMQVSRKNLTFVICYHYHFYYYYSFELVSRENSNLTLVLRQLVELQAYGYKGFVVRLWYFIKCLTNLLSLII